MIQAPLVRGCSRGEEEEVLAVREKARPEMLAFVRRSIDLRHLLRFAARGRHDEDAFATLHRKVGEENRATAAPTWKRVDRALADGLDDASRHRNTFQRSAGPESDPLAVRGPERDQRVLGSGQGP